MAIPARYRQTKGRRVLQKGSRGSPDARFGTHVVRAPLSMKLSRIAEIRSELGEILVFLKIADWEPPKITRTATFWMENIKT